MAGLLIHWQRITLKGTEFPDTSDWLLVAGSSRSWLTAFRQELPVGAG